MLFICVEFLMWTGSFKESKLIVNILLIVVKTHVKCGQFTKTECDISKFVVLCIYRHLH